MFDFAEKLVIFKKHLDGEWIGGWIQGYKNFWKVLRNA
jgi:hypothetical protein